jgi:hypothetical protein
MANTGLTGGREARDVVKAIISDKEFVIEQLEMYIRGHR